MYHPGKGKRGNASKGAGKSTPKAQQLPDTAPSTSSSSPSNLPLSHPFPSIVQSRISTHPPLLSTPPETPLPPASLTPHPFQSPQLSILSPPPTFPLPSHPSSNQTQSGFSTIPPLLSPLTSPLPSPHPSSNQTQSGFSTVSSFLSLPPTIPYSEYLLESQTSPISPSILPNFSQSLRLSIWTQANITPVSSGLAAQ